LVLVQAALLLFGICAVAALTLDLGYATLARVQMQNAADSAAIEGLRFRDALPDAQRRAKASEMAEWIFDDDFDLSSDAKQLGAGPVVGLSAGQSDLNAFQTVQSIGVYKPALKPNLANEIDGDIVAGTFTPGVSGTEESDYTRLDFTPPGDTALLVRLRRSNEAFGAGDASRSNGPSIPFLLGRGSTMQASQNGYSPRIDGLTVRATAIADARPARSVGNPIVTPPSPGVTNFALERSFWEALQGNALVTVDAGGTISLGLTPAGRFLLTGSGRVIGSPLAPAAPSGDSAGFVPVYELIAGIERIVGFGTAQIAVAAGTAVVTKSPSQVALVNASVQLAGAQPALSQAEWTLIFESNRTLADALLAPGLVR